VTASKPDPDEKSIHRLINRLGTFYTKRRESAKKRLSEMPNELVRPIMLGRMKSDMRSNRSWQWQLNLGLLALCLTFMVLIHHITPHYPPNASMAEMRHVSDVSSRALLYLTIAYGSILFAGMQLSTGIHCRRNIRVSQAMELLSDRDDVALVGPLIDLNMQPLVFARLRKLAGPTN
jgi:hypothetical protein